MINSNVAKILQRSAIAMGLCQILLSTPATAASTLLFNDFLPPNHPFAKGIFEPWAKRVENATEGRVKIKFSSSSLGPPQKQWNLITKGIADVTMLANPFERNRLVLPQIAELPWMAPTAEQASVALWRTHQKFFTQANEYKGVELLALWALSGSQILHRSKPITRISDLKGEKIWALSSSAIATIKVMGGVPVPAPGVKMFTMISHGVVDGLVTPQYTLTTFQVARYIRHFTSFPGGVGANSFSLFLNRKKFERLSRDSRNAIHQISGEQIARDARSIDNANQAAFEEFKSKIKWIKADRPLIIQLRKRLAFLQHDWIEKAAKRGVDGKAAISYYKSQLK